MLTVTTGELPVTPPPTVSKVNPHLIALEAGLWLARGNVRAAEWLIYKAEALREGGR